MYFKVLYSAFYSIRNNPFILVLHQNLFTPKRLVHNYDKTWWMSWLSDNNEPIRFCFRSGSWSGLSVGYKTLISSAEVWAISHIAQKVPGNQVSFHSSGGRQNLDNMIVYIQIHTYPKVLHSNRCSYCVFSSWKSMHFPALAHLNFLHSDHVSATWRLDSQ